MSRILLFASGLLSALAVAQPLRAAELPADAVRGLSSRQLEVVLKGLQLAGAPDCANAAECLRASLQNLRIATQLAREARTAEQIAAAIGLPEADAQPQGSRDWYEVPVPKGAPSRGPESAPITVVTWLDYQCPFSQRHQTTLRALGEKYGARVRFVVRHLPLPFHTDAAALAAMSLYAQDKGRFWDFHDRLFAMRAPNRASARLVAAELKLDPAALDAAVTDPRYKQLLERDAADARAVDATGTPTTSSTAARSPAPSPSRTSSGSSTRS